jgi:hypothetical protein
MRKLSVLTICLFCSTLFAQDLSFSKSGKNVYQELTNPAKTSAEEWSKVTSDINVSFASDNIRYPKERVPSVSSENWIVTAWKGEKVHSQILVWTKKSILELSVKTGDLVNENGVRINSNKINTAFVRYVMTDEFGEGCGERKKTDYDSSLVEDPLDIINKISVKPNTVQPIWLTVKVPGDIPAGKYYGTITINAEKKFDLKISLNVLNHLLPPPSEWKFDLDLWQSPVPVAQVHDVKLWSDKHFALMKPYFTMLADAGQKSITAIIIDQPWGSGHTFCKDPSLVTWTRKKDGSWSYDYKLFDRYVDFMMSCGINKRINCYSMVTWDLRFIYFDEAKGDTTSLSLKPGSVEYLDFWTPMLKDFTKHLKGKGWFGITSIAMDERPLQSMQAVISLLKQIDPDWKIALAGGAHPEIAKDIYDYCIIIGEKFDPDLLKERKDAGKPSTYYTACGERYPNGFSYSPPAENTWIGWYAAAAGYTGYLRWAYNNWTESTLTETRYRTWPAGDCYQVYPGPRTSIRFEKLIEGIQDFEKIRILKEQFLQDGHSQHLRELDDALSGFTMGNLAIIPAADMVSKGKRILNEF